MAGYAFNWSDSSITDAMSNVKCSGMISEAGGDGYGGTNWCFAVVGGGGQQWHIHFNGGADGRKVNVIRLKASSSDSGGDNMLKYLDAGRGYPTEKTNLKGLVTCSGTTYPQHAKLFTALLQALNTFVEA